MRYVILITCLCVFHTSFQSCNKQIEIPDSVVGRWELRTTSAAMMPTPTNYAAGNGNILRFTETAYEKYINGQLVKTGVYTIIRDATVDESVCMDIPADQFNFRIIYDYNYISPREFIHISNNRLHFISGCYAYDAGHTEGYEKIGK